MAILFNNKVEVRIATRRGAVAGGVRALRCERHVNNGLSIVDVFEKSASVVLMRRHWPLASDGVFARSYVQSTSACFKPWISRCVKRSGMMPTSQPREQESAKTAVIAFLLQYTATLAATRIFAGFCKLDTHTNFVCLFFIAHAHQHVIVGYRLVDTSRGRRDCCGSYNPILHQIPSSRCTETNISSMATH